MKHGIVVPCFNESSRLELSTFIEFARIHIDTVLCFVNDGSTDATRSTLADVKNLQHENVYIFNVEENAGKANAVRKGALFLYRETDAETIGFLDADLSTSFEEYNNLVVEIECNEHLQLVFGSRNMDEGSGQIERNPARKLLSDFIRLLIYFITRLRIADTQCGAKVFRRELIPTIYTSSFFSRWLFDVEILLRLKKKLGAKRLIEGLLEKQLNEWVHMEGSKLNLKDSIMIPLNLLQIWVEYKLKPWWNKKLLAR